MFGKIRGFRECPRFQVSRERGNSRANAPVTVLAFKRLVAVVRAFMNRQCASNSKCLAASRIIAHIGFCGMY